MWRVDPPNYSASFSFRTCIGKIRDPDLKKRLQEAEAEVVAAAESYAAAAELDAACIGAERLLSP